MIGMERDDLIRRLKCLDEEASLMFDNTDRIRIVIAGGGALVLMEYISRSTHDIDVLSVSHQIQELMLEYDMNTRVQTYINNFPYNYEDRLHKIDIEGKIIDYYTASLEDIVIAKLYSNRDSDMEDVSVPDVISHINWDLLHYLATDEGEARASAISEYRYREFLNTFNEYERRYRPCEN